jgi:RimJ/RimL family protein N-acetyltransferase
MNLDIEVQELLPRDWQRLRTLRLASLADSPQAYGASYEVEAELPERTWRERMSTVRYVTAIIAEQDIAVMSIEEMDGDFGANIWLGGCWVDPSVRGQGVMRVMLNYIDSIADERNWRCQGLGVWPNNFDAIAAYEKLGFVKRGELQQSSRKPGLFFQRMIRQSPESF